MDQLECYNTRNKARSSPSAPTFEAPLPNIEFTVPITEASIIQEDILLRLQRVPLLAEGLLDPGSAHLPYHCAPPRQVTHLAKLIQVDHFPQRAQVHLARLVISPAVTLAEDSPRDGCPDLEHQIYTQTHARLSQVYDQWFKDVLENYAIRY